jgi:Flp pilus assembly pilin Flp
MTTKGLLNLIDDEAGFHATELTLAITLITLAIAIGVFTFGGSVTEFLGGADEDVKTSIILMPSFGQNPLTN